MPVLCFFVFSSSLCSISFLCLDDIYFWNIFWEYVLIFAFVRYIDSHLLKHSWNINNFWMYGHMTASEDHFKLINSFRTLLYFFVKKRKTKLLFIILSILSPEYKARLCSILVHICPCVQIHVQLHTCVWKRHGPACLAESVTCVVSFVIGLPSERLCVASL